MYKAQVQMTSLWKSPSAMSRVSLPAQGASDQPYFISKFPWARHLMSLCGCVARLYDTDPQVVDPRLFHLHLRVSFLAPFSFIAKRSLFCDHLSEIIFSFRLFCRLWKAM
jgi:hypothetical protein